MKKILTVSFVAVLAGCGGGSGDSSSTGALPSSTEVSTTSPGSVAAVESSTFLSNAYQEGLGEVELSQLAVDKATDEETRNFAQRMIEHHTLVNNEIRELAQAMTLTLPTEPTEEESAALETLSNLDGIAFDQAYMEHKVTAHEDDFAQFRAQALGDDDPEISAFALNTLTVVQAHLLAAKTIDGRIDPEVFLMNIYQDGLGEIQLSTLALERATDPDVRAFAQRMVDEHTQANTDISQLAQQQGITLPTELSVADQAAYDDLSKLSGSDFDKAYMNHNVIVHELAVLQAGAQVDNGTDADISSLAADLLPTLLSHLQEAVDLYNAIEPSVLQRTFQDGLGEILLSKLALQLSSDPGVLDFAQLIINDHTEANRNLLQLAEQNNQTLPLEISPEQLRDYIELSQQTNGEFDQNYIQRNVEVHSEDVQVLQQTSDTLTDEEARAYAEDLVNVLTQHLQQAQEIATRVGAPA